MIVFDTKSKTNNPNRAQTALVAEIVTHCNQKIISYS
jgi:hypothetical protein